MAGCRKGRKVGRLYCWRFFHFHAFLECGEWRTWSFADLFETIYCQCHCWRLSNDALSHSRRCCENRPSELSREIKPNSIWLVASRLDTTRHVRRVESVETSVSSCAVRQARHSKNAWARHVEHVVSRRDVTSPCILEHFKRIFFAFPFRRTLTATLVQGGPKK